MPQENKNIDKRLDTLTDFDIIELYIKCVEVFTETSSRLDIEQKRCFELGQVLWDKSIEARDEYRKGHSDKDPKR